MEGLADHFLRDALTRIGGYDAAVSEFIRVTGSLLPRRTWERICPEVGNACRTPAGTPMAIQLLGSDADWLARNAARAAGFVPPAIDLNFGCPAKLVNRHGGGAMLLGDPERLLRIARAVRTAVPAAIPITAKMRLGITDTSLTLACAQALAAGGVARLVVHARTRDQGYRPPAHWEWIARIREAVDIPVIANGEIWTVADWQRCRAVSGCSDVMLGRGAVADPFLALRIRGEMNETPSPTDWQALLPHIRNYWRQLQEHGQATRAPGRIKLLLGYWSRTWPEAAALHTAIRRINDPLTIANLLEAMQDLAQPDGA
ncbi:MAG: tRNA-dihydrouridine synthase [Sterolibacterium sp.]|nr:tRNA-dihydrouridine synthase [Sterolibacterium sp.]